MSNIAAKHFPKRRRWVVDFSFRVRDDGQSRALAACGLLAHDVVRTYLNVLLPGSLVLEPDGTPIKQILFRTRRDMRRFQGVWGGKLLPAG
jgi:hypothetical protein